MSNSVLIRPEQPSDFAAIDKVITDVFAAMPMSDHREVELVHALRQTRGSIPALALVADLDPEIVGQVLLTQIHIQTAAEQLPVLALAPLSVLPQFQHHGIGSQLLHEAYRRAQAWHHKAILVLGDPAFYSRFGYVFASRFGLHFPFAVPEQYCLAIELQPGALKDAAGEVLYSAPFLS